MDRTVKIAQARFAAEDIIYRYAETLDAGDIESMAALFEKGVVLLPDGKELEGPKAVFEHYRDLIHFYSSEGEERPYERLVTTPMTRHVTTNVRCEVNNDVRAVAAFSYFTLYQQNGDHIDLIAGGRYEDHFARDLSGWHITSRTFHIEQRGDMSRHLKTA
ncbi:MAG: nuclear transport factor 2 family protein [Pseudomonadales bacterium]